MKNHVTATAVALILGIAAPTFAMTSSSPLETSVVNSIHRIDSSIEIPALTDQDLGFLKTVLEDSEDDNWEKAAKVRQYFDRS